MNTKPQTYAEALASTPEPVKGHDGFATVEYAPSVGTTRPRTITILLYNGTEVSRGSRRDILAALGHADTRKRYMKAAQ